MATATLQQIQDQIAFEIDGNASISSSSSDWGQRLAPINRALHDWAETYDWEELKLVHNGVISTSTGNASYALPANFKKLDGYLRIASDGSNVFEYSQVDVSKNNQYNSSDKFVNILGSPRTGYVMYIHTDALVSGASVQFTYFASPMSLVSAGSVADCPDPSYITQRALYYIYKSREDGRFPEAKVEADRILSRMIENESSVGLASKESSVQSWLQAKHGFRIGRDG